MQGSRKKSAIVLAVLACLVLLAVGSRWWRTRGGVPVHATYHHRAGSSGALAFHPSGHSLLVMESDGIVALDTKTWRPQERLQAANTILEMAVSHDGQTLVTDVFVEQKGGIVLYQVQIWDLSKGLGSARPIHVIDAEKSSAHPSAISLSPDGFKLAVAWQDPDDFLDQREESAVSVYELSTAKELATLEKRFGWVTTTAFSSDGGTLITSGIDGLRQWNTETGSQLSKPILAVGGVLEAASADGMWLAIHETAGVVIRDASAGTTRATVPYKRANTNTRYEFSPDGKILAELRTDVAESKGSPFEQILQWVGISPAGSARDYHCTLTFWDAESGKRIASIPDLEGPLTTVAFSPEREFLAVGGYTRSVLIWRVDDVLAAAKSSNFE